MVDSGLVHRYLRQALYGNKTETKEDTILSPLKVEDVEGHFMVLIIGLSSIIVLELLKTVVYLILLRSRASRKEVAASSRGYAVKLMVRSHFRPEVLPEGDSGSQNNRVSPCLCTGLDVCRGGKSRRIRRGFE